MEKPDILSWRPDHSTGTSNNKDVTLLYPEIFAVQTLEDVELEGTERNVLSNIYKGNCSKDQKEPIV